MSETRAMDLVRDLYDAFTAKGPRVIVDRYGDWFAEDFEWAPVLLSSVDGRVYRGETEFREYWDEFLAVFPDVSLTAGSLEAIGADRVLLTADIHAKGAGSGVPIDRTVAFLFEVHNERITAGRTFFSPRDAREFLAHA